MLQHLGAFLVGIVIGFLGGLFGKGGSAYTQHNTYQQNQYDALDQGLVMHASSFLSRVKGSLKASI